MTKKCPKCGIERTEEEVREQCESLGIWKDYEKFYPGEEMESFNCPCGTTISLIKKKVFDVINKAKDE